MIESIEKLRDELQICEITGSRPTIAFVAQCADEIEREIAESYMELPCDADGVPIHPGNRVELDGKGGEVWLVGTTDVMCSSGLSYRAVAVNNVKPRTLEDVLEEYYDKRGWDEADNCALDADELTAKYADEIEAEVESRYVLLPEGWTDDQASDVLDLWPKWDDGSPCMFGDEFTCYPKYDHREQYEVFDRLTIYGRNHVWHRGEDRERPHDGGFYEWNYMRPGGDGAMDYRPKKRTLRTIEDVLRDLVDGIDSVEFDALTAIGEAADEIRELMEVDR